MDCKTAHFLLNFVRPVSAELEADEAAALASHLADCEPCRQLHQAEQALEDPIRGAMRAVPIPDGLRDRLLSRLAQQRRQLNRRRLIQVGSGLAAAVLLLLGWNLWPRSLIPIELAGPETNFASADQVVDAFRHKGIAAQVPAEFNYGLLTHYGWGEFRGQRVPVVELVNGPAFLRVFILDRERFDLASSTPQAEVSGRVTVKWWGKSRDGRFGYIVEYTGPSWEPFTARDPLPPT